MKHTALLQLVCAKGAGDAAVRRLADYCARKAVTPEEAVTLPEPELPSALGVTLDVAQNIVAARSDASRLASELDAEGIELLWLNDERYPARLRSVLGDEAPPLLFVKGNINLLSMPSVGFCGSRKASDKGLGVTAHAARILANENVCVVSGYAHGVDLAAHRAALEAGGTTVFVLVEGICRFGVKKDIGDVLNAENHLAVSQFPPKLTWLARNAMKRNGTIIGLSDAMILVESGREGGTFAAGTESLRRNHPLFVVDFAEPGPSAEANPHFIERGGKPIRGDSRHIPKLEQVLEITRHPRWRENGVHKQLF